MCGADGAASGRARCNRANHGSRRSSARSRIESPIPSRASATASAAGSSSELPARKRSRVMRASVRHRHSPRPRRRPARRAARTRPRRPAPASLRALAGRSRRRSARSRESTASRAEVRAASYTRIREFAATPVAAASAIAATANTHAAAPWRTVVPIWIPYPSTRRATATLPLDARLGPLPTPAGGIMPRIPTIAADGPCRSPQMPGSVKSPRVTLRRTLCAISRFRAHRYGSPVRRFASGGSASWVSARESVSSCSPASRSSSALAHLHAPEQPSSLTWIASPSRFCVCWIRRRSGT